MLSTLHWDNIETPLLLMTWLIAIIVARIGFHSFHPLSKIFPESAVLIILGLAAGYIIYEVFRLDLYLHPDLFFLYLLPPIVLEAGFFMPSNAFFNNIGTILLYAVVGTLLNIVGICFTIYIFSPLYNHTLSFITILLYSTIISAVDPVAVLSLFEEIHVNQILYICVFGESLLNDAVTVVLYHSLSSLIHVKGGPILDDFIDSTFNFILVSVGGVLLGATFVCITALASKYASVAPILQPLICLVFPYLSYLLSEYLHLSAILSIVTCGLLMRTYIKGNLSVNPLITVRYMVKTLSSCCEAIIFVFLGLSTFSKKHDWDISFAVVTVTACVISRFIAVFLLTKLANRRRVQKIAFRDQIIMAFGGIRGAICYGLVLSIDEQDIPSKQMLISTTLCVICVTVFIQGTTIKPLVKILDVKKEATNKDTVAETVFKHSLDDIIMGVEAILGVKGSHYWHRRLTEVNHGFVQPALMRTTTSRGKQLVEKYSTMCSEEQRQRLLDSSFHL